MFSGAVIGHSNATVALATVTIAVIVLSLVDTSRVTGWQISFADDVTMLTSSSAQVDDDDDGELIPILSTTSINETETTLSIEEVVRLSQEIQSTLDRKTSNFDTNTLTVLVTLFVFLITFGVAGNGLVCYVVIANPHMRSPRNILIMNLALSDMILCCFTQPFNLMKVSEL